MADLVSEVITLLWITTSSSVGDPQLTCIHVCYCCLICCGLIHPDHWLMELKSFLYTYFLLHIVFGKELTQGFVVLLLL